MKTKKPMTERQAWLYLAKKFEEEPKRPYTEGICYALDNVSFLEPRIKPGMRCRVMIELSRKERGPLLYPLTPAGRRKRAALCRRFAKEASRKVG